ncbi:MAG: hypothetical protein FIB04_08110 [Gammaproteobacteria bacterium]|nr:hypothetical protein [Gammaproteobacteria bacterium]
MSEKKKSQRSFRLRKPAEQVDLPLPPPPGPPLPAPEIELAWWQRPAAVGSIAALAMLLAVATLVSQVAAHRDRDAAAAAEARVRSLTLRASTAEHALRIAPNPRSWSAMPDATIQWPEPPELLDLYLPVGYSDFTTFGLTIDKVDVGRVLVVQRMAPDSNRELRLTLNSSAFGRGEYRIRIDGYTWRGDRAEAGWVRLVIK